MTAQRPLAGPILSLLLIACHGGTPAININATHDATSLAAQQTKAPTTPTATSTVAPAPTLPPNAVVVPDNWVPFTPPSGAFTLYHPDSWTPYIPEGGLILQFGLPRHLVTAVDVTVVDPRALGGSSDRVGNDQQVLDSLVAALDSTYTAQENFELVASEMSEDRPGYVIEYAFTLLLDGTRTRIFRLCIAVPLPDGTLVLPCCARPRGWTEPQIPVDQRAALDMLARSITSPAEPAVRITPTPGPTPDPKVAAREFEIAATVLMRPAFDAEWPLYGLMGLLEKGPAASDPEDIAMVARAAAKAWEAYAREVTLIETSAPELREAKQDLVAMARKRAGAFRWLVIWTDSHDPSDLESAREAFAQTTLTLLYTLDRSRAREKPGHQRRLPPE